MNWPAIIASACTFYLTVAFLFAWYRIRRQRAVAHQSAQRGFPYE